MANTYLTWFPDNGETQAEGVLIPGVHAVAARGLDRGADLGMLDYGDAARIALLIKLIEGIVLPEPVRVTAMRSPGPPEEKTFAIHRIQLTGLLVAIEEP